MACAKLNEFVTVTEEQRISAYEKRADPVSSEGSFSIDASRLLRWRHAPQFQLSTPSATMQRQAVLLATRPTNPNCIDKLGFTPAAS